MTARDTGNMLQTLVEEAEDGVSVKHLTLVSEWIVYWRFLTCLMVAFRVGSG